MKIRDIKAECEQQIASIVRNRKFWSEQISFLKKDGAQPATERVIWIRKHIEGLDASQKWLEDYIAREGQNA